MRPYYFDFDEARTRRTRTILAFERAPRSFRRPPPRRETSIWHEIVKLLRLWRRRIRNRRELASLDHRMQRDIGVTPADIARECEKPFWRE